MVDPRKSREWKLARLRNMLTTLEGMPLDFWEDGLAPMVKVGVRSRDGDTFALVTGVVPIEPPHDDDD